MYSHMASLYKQQEIQTASPGKIVLMLYDGALKNLSLAEQADQQQDYFQKTESLGKVRSIIVELLNTLDMKQGGEIAHQLQSLYVYSLNQLMTADINQDFDALRNVYSVLNELREAFAIIVNNREVKAG